MRHQDWLEEPYENADRQDRADEQLHQQEWERCVDEDSPLLHPTVLTEYCEYFNDVFRDEPLTYEEWVGEQDPIDILKWCLKFHTEQEPRIVLFNPDGSITDITDNL
jgi:hypothetical protein